MQQFDANMLRSILTLPDEQLWQTIQMIAASSGVRLPSGAPPKSELAKLRGILTSDAPDVNEAMRIVEQYKRTGGV